MKLRASIPDLLSLLSRQLYSQPEAFIRELIANAHDAIVRRNRSGRVTVVGDGLRSVTVEDDGLGMTAQEVDGFLSLIGASGTRAAASSSTTIGRFGIGFLSALGAADTVVVDTLSVQPRSTPVRWRWEGGDDYTLELGALTVPGTSVFVELKEEFAAIAKPARLAAAVRRYARFLPIPILVPPLGDPREGPAPWQGLSPGSVVRDLAPFNLEGELPQSPIHSFTGRMRNASGFWLSVSRERSSGGRLLVFQRGMLVCESAQLLPPELSWVSGVVDAADATLAIDRESIRDDHHVATLARDLREAIEREIAFLASARPALFELLLAAHGLDVCRLLMASGRLEVLAASYRFTSTLGRLTFSELLAGASVDAQRRSLRYTEQPPLTDSRWAMARAQGRVVVWCQEVAEKDLLIHLVRSALDTDLIELKWGDPAAAATEVFPVELSLRRGLDRLRSELAPHHVSVELSLLQPAALASIAELSGLVQSGEGDATPLSRVMTALGRTSSTASGRLILNASNPGVRAMLSNDGERSSSAVAATLLAGGVARSGFPLPALWEPLLDELIAAALSDGPGKVARTLVPHIVCFFAHEFRIHKHLLEGLRDVLEDEPYFWEVRSADEASDAPRLYDSVYEHLNAADFVVGEVSSRNPNVILELGIAYGLKEPSRVALLAQKEGYVRFSDIADHLVFLYDGSRPAPDVARGFERWLLQTPAVASLRGGTPFLGYRLLTKIGFTPPQIDRLRREYPDPLSLLSASTAGAVEVTNIPPDRISRAQAFLRRRMERHRTGAPAALRP